MYFEFIQKVREIVKGRNRARRAIRKVEGQRRVLCTNQASLNFEKCQKSIFLRSLRQYKAQFCPNKFAESAIKALKCDLH